MKRVLAACLFLVSSALSAHAKELPDFTELAEKQGVAVVNISSTQALKGKDSLSPHGNLSEDDPAYEYFRRFMPPQIPPHELEAKSLGSGLIVSSDGYILTNAHVVDDADEVTVKLTDKREFKAKIVGSDKRTDVALIKIDATDLPKVTLGNPSKLKVGEWVVAIGSPFGFENSITAGIVSAKGRSLPQENYVPFIQTDVAINPGNSGGPLFNLKGEVVGINSQIYSRTGGYMGLSFAIPIDVAMDVGNQLRASGKVSRGWLGVGIQEVTKDLAESFGLSKAAGALVVSLEKDSPSHKAGLYPSDVILKFDGKPIGTSSELPQLVGPTRPGTKVVIQVWRKGAVKDIDLVVGELPEAGKLAKHHGKPQPKVANRLGLVLAELSAAQRQELKIDNGLLVEDVQGTATRSGVRRGDVVLALNNADIRTVGQFEQLLSQYGSGRIVALLVRRSDSSLYIPMKVGEK
ncbi:MAG: DegQ family serine endoprotease [Pseudomonadota bacterium]